jgi:hypothetical protein
VKRYSNKWGQSNSRVYLCYVHISNRQSEANIDKLEADGVINLFYSLLFSISLLSSKSTIQAPQAIITDLINTFHPFSSFKKN